MRSLFRLASSSSSGSGISLSIRRTPRSTFHLHFRCSPCHKHNCHRLQGTPLPQTLPTRAFSSITGRGIPLLQNTVQTTNMCDNKDFLIPLDQPVVALECNQAFNGLTPQEQKYAHWLSKAGWAGGLIALVQTSPESPAIFSILLDMFKATGVAELKELALKECQFSEDDWKALMVYVTALLANMGNYKGFGDTKFVPDVACEKLCALVSKAKFTVFKPEDVETIWPDVRSRMFLLKDKYKQLGLGEQGISTYFSANCTKEDAAFVSKFLKQQHLEGWNTRCFKTSETGADGKTVPVFEIRHASVKPSSQVTTSEFEGAKFKLTSGDYSPLLRVVNQELKKAIDFASNDTEKKMLAKYIESFETGDINAHKDGSRLWVKNVGPAIETYIGFIENYRDPSGIRSEFEAFVAAVNRPMSKKFATLVQNAPEYLNLLPWPKEFEKDTFLKPDFTSLDVLTFSGSGIPAGINIPNYDEIRQNEGFKNVSLGNVIPASYKDSVIPFLSPEDQEILQKYRVPSFEVQVALHELLGHGSGKLLKKEKDGTLNFSPDLKNPLTGQVIESYYEAAENFDSVFADIGSAYEECRAECVGLYLSLDKDILKNVFGHTGNELEDVLYANWLSMIFAGTAKALEMYQPGPKVWGQAHSRARFAILQVLIEAGEGLITVEETVGSDGLPDLLVTLDRSKIETVGKKAIGDFLLKLQVYKSTANVKSAQEMFAGYTAVHNEGKYPWLKWRDIVMAKKQPRKCFVQHNTELGPDGKVVLKTYEPTAEGVVQSWVERFDNNTYVTVQQGLRECWEKDAPFFE